MAYRYVWRLASVAESVHVLSGVVGMVLSRSVGAEADIYMLDFWR